MKDLSLLVWLTQLGLSVAAPLAGFVLLGLWLHNDCGWGMWIVWVCITLGIGSAIGGFRDTLRTISRLAKDKKKDAPPPISFNDHN